MPAAKHSSIGWTDFSGGDLNFICGCTKISPGCQGCYARRIYKRFGKDFSKVTVYPDKLERLLTWQPQPPYKRGPGSRPMAFPVDMGDLLHEEVPDWFIFRAFQVMSARADIDWLVLTKRARRMRRLLGMQHRAENIWLGVSVESPDYLWRIDELLKTPAAVRWISYEPALAPIDITPYLLGISWICIGAESGANRRLFKRTWAWDVLDQCRAANVPCFLKQDSGPRPGAPLLDRKGNEVKEFPNASSFIR